MTDDKRQIRNLAYDLSNFRYCDLMEVADQLVRSVADLADSGDDFDPTDRHSWAELLSAWAAGWLENNPREDR